MAVLEDPGSGRLPLSEERARALEGGRLEACITMDLVDVVDWVDGKKYYPM
jgi:hypothetical protein